MARDDGPESDPFIKLHLDAANRLDHVFVAQDFDGIIQRSGSRCPLPFVIVPTRAARNGSSSPAVDDGDFLAPMRPPARAVYADVSADDGNAARSGVAKSVTDASARLQRQKVVGGSGR